MNKKRIFSALLAFALMAALLPVHVFAAAITPDETGVIDDVGQGAAGQEIMDHKMPTGRVPGKMIDFGEADPEESLEAVGSYASYTPYEVVSDWDDYASNYYYNRMSGWQRKVYDRMEEAAKYYLNTEENISGDEEDGSHYIQVDLYDIQLYEFQASQLFDVYSLFLHSNPQYFFLQTSMGGDSYPRNGRILNIHMIVYDEMADGAKRRNAVDAVNSQIDSALEAANSASGQLEQEKAIHDWICGRVAYDYEGLAKMPDENATKEERAIWDAYEAIHYTQSAYSVFRSDLPEDKTQYETVCAGYAQAYELLCNALDIDTISVTSNTHQWNQTRLNGRWYVVDCTWDDDEDDYYYMFFNRSTAAVMEYDKVDHVPERYQSAYLPYGMCAADKIYEEGDEQGIKPGTVREADGKANSPSDYSAYTLDNNVYMTLTAADGSEVYYTTDGTVPTVNDEKSILYKEAFAVNAGADVRAVSYKNGYLDSDVFQVTVPAASGLEKRYTVYFDGNGGTAAKDYNIVVNGKTYGTLPNVSRTGYRFDGWYTAKSGGKKVTAGSLVQLTGKQTLYARWTANKYQITYDVNGGNALTSQQKTKQVTYGNKYGTLAAPKRRGYTFSGWYTKKSGGSKIGAASTVTITKATTLYAHWKKVTVKKAGKPVLKSTKARQLKITCKKVSGANGYRIRYSTSKKFTKKTTHSVLQTTLSGTVKKLKSGKTYYVQVRAYKLDSTGKKVYGKWSAAAVKAVK